MPALYIPVYLQSPTTFVYFTQIYFRSLTKEGSIPRMWDRGWWLAVVNDERIFKETSP